MMHTEENTGKVRILVTGAAGRTGLTVINALRRKDPRVFIRAFAHREDQFKALKECGADEAIAGDMLRPGDVCRAMDGVDAVYHICSTANEFEYEAGENVYSAAVRAGACRFVYHSVLHSLLSELPHHEKKHRVETVIAQGELPYVILQPAALMQNLLNAKEMVLAEGVLMQRFFSGEDVRMNLVDLDDVAEAAALVLTGSGYDYGTYELCGPQNLSEKDILSAFEKVTGRRIVSRFIPDEVFAEQMSRQGRSAYYTDTLLTMFSHYQRHGFMGSPAQLGSLLGRKPSDLEDFLEREIRK